MLLSLAPSIARADVGLPMLAVTLPATLIALIPVILIEALYLRRRLRISFDKAMGGSVVANLASTLVGLPLCWAVLVGLEIVSGGGGATGIDTVMGRIGAVTWQAAWLVPYEHEMEWMIPAASLTLLVPFYFASWLTEYLVVRRVWKDQPRAVVRVAIRNANLITYAIQGVVALTWLAWALRSRPST